MTNSQIDRLGDRLKASMATEDDLRLLDQFRASFADSYEHVVTVVREQVGLASTGRQAKTTASIVAKLKREKTRLSRMQDVAGCRVILDDLVEQIDAAEQLERAFSNAKLVNRLFLPSHGYRAIHVIVTANEKPIEIQVRTRLQHLWAELSEKLSDRIDSSIKYGGGTEELRTALAKFSDLILSHEAQEWFVAENTQHGALAHELHEGYHEQVRVNRSALESRRRELIQLFQRAISIVDRVKR